VFDVPILLFIIDTWKFSVLPICCWNLWWSLAACALVECVWFCGGVLMIVLMDNKLPQLLLNACYVHSGALVHVVTDVIDSKAVKKSNCDYNWQLDFNSCLSASETGSDVEKVVVKW